MFFFFQDIDPDDENMQLFLSMGVEINGVVKKVSFITLSKEKVILLIKKSDGLRIFLFRYKNLWGFFSAFFVHSFTSFTIVLDALHRTFVDLLISFIFFNVVCLFGFFFSFLFLFTHFFDFLSILFFFFFGFSFVTVS